MPRDLDQEPSEDAIRELHVWNETHWSAQRTLDTELTALLRDEHAVKVTDTAAKERKSRLEPERMTLGEGPRTIDVIFGLHSQPPTLGVMWIGEGARAPAKSDKLEIALNELIDQLNPPTDSPRKRQTKQLIGLGREAGLYLPGNAYWWDTPRKAPGQSEVAAKGEREEWKRKAPIPILWRDLPAESTFPPSLGMTNDLALSRLRTTWHELQDIFSDEELSEVLPPPEERFNEVTLAIYANRGWVAYALLLETAGVGVGAVRVGAQKRTHILRKIEHHMGRCPIRILAGRTSAWKEPGQYWRSALHNVREMIPQLDRRASEAATASRITVLPLLKVWLNRRDDDDGARIKKLMHGDILELDAGDSQAGVPREDMEAAYIPPLGRENIELLQLQRDTIRGLTGAHEALTAGSVAASMPAWSLNFVSEHQKAFQKELTEAVIAAAIDQAETLMACVQAFDETIVLQRRTEDGGAITLEPDDLDKWSVILKGEYRLQTPVNEIARIQTAVSVMQAIDQSNLPIDPFYIMETHLDIEQPFEMFKRAEVTKFLRSPELAAWRMKILLEEADVELGGDEWMSPEEFERDFAGGIPPQMAQFARQKLGGEARGAGRAGAPFSARPGGRQPQEVAP